MNAPIPQELGSGLLLDLGKAIGVIDTDGNFNAGWFNSPGQQMIDLVQSAGAHERRLALLRVLDELFDPGDSTLRGDTWSLALGDSGLDLLIRATESDGGTGTEFSIGIGGKWTLISGEGAEPKLELEGQFGLLTVDVDHAGNDFGDKIKLAEGVDLRIVLSELTSNPDILDSLAVAAHVPFYAVEDTTIALQLQGIGPTNEDLSFTFDTSPEWAEFEGPVFRLIVLAVAVLVGQIPPEAGDAKLAAQNLLALFGWADGPGDSSSTDYPELGLDALIANPGLAIQTWLQTIWADFDEAASAPAAGAIPTSNKVRLFLERLLGMLRADSALTVESDGQYVVVYPTALTAARLELVLWSTTDSAGAERVHMGVRVSVRDELGSSGPLLVFEALADIFSFPLSGPITAEVVGEFSLDLRLSPRAGESHALDLSAAGLSGALSGESVPELEFLGSLRVGELVAGLKLDANGTCEPLVELRRLSIGEDDHEKSWPVLDLTDGGAVVEIGTDMATAAVAGAIRSALGATPEGKALAILIGLDTPDAQLAYPQLDPLAFVEKPLDAYEVWIGSLLGDRGADPQWFKTWLDTLRGLLDSIDGYSVPVVAGSGELGEPWRLELTQGSAGDVAFEFHVTPDATGGAARTLGVDLAATPAVVDLGISARFESRAAVGLLELSVDDPSADDPSVDVRPVPGASVYAALIPPEGDLSIQADLDVFSLGIARFVASVAWERGQDPVPAFDLVDPAIVLGAERFDLGDLSAHIPSFPGGALPSLRFEALSPASDGLLSGFGIGAFDGGGLSLSVGDLPDFGSLDLSAENFGFTSDADGQWFVETAEFMVRLITLGLPSWALDGDEGDWRSWTVGVVQLLGGWPGLDLGTAGGAPITWPSSDLGQAFQFDLSALSRFVANPFEGLSLRLGQLFTVPGGGQAGMALLWRWLRTEMPRRSGAPTRVDIPEVTGEGTYADPFAIRLNDEVGGADPSARDFPVELIVWVDPDGPPSVAGAATPTHVGFGVRLDLAPDPIAGPFELDTYFRADLFTLDVSAVTGASGTARPTPALSLEGEIRHEDRDDDDNDNGWLLNEDSSAIKLRAVEFGLTWAPTHSDEAQRLVPRFELIDAGYQDGIDGPVTTGDLAGLIALSVGGVLLDHLAQPGKPLADDSMSPLMVIFESLGVATSEAGGGYRFLAEPMVRLLDEPVVYLRERFWDTATDVPRLRPLEPAFEELGFTVSTDEPWQVEVPLGDQILRLEADGTLRVTLDEAVADTVDVAVEAMFNPFSGRTEGLLTTRVGAAKLELVASWSDADGYGSAPGVFELGLYPIPESPDAEGHVLVPDMENLFGGPLMLWPVADADFLAERALTIGYRLGIEVAIGALYSAFLEPHVQTLDELPENAGESQLRRNLVAFGILDGTSGRPNPLWELFDNPADKILGKLRELRGTFPITEDWEIFADEGLLALRSQGGEAITIDGQNSLLVSIGVDPRNWSPAISLGFNYALDPSTLITVTAGLDGTQPLLDVCGLPLLPTFGGFEGQLGVDDALQLLLPAVLTGTLVGLDQLGDGTVDDLVTATYSLVGIHSPSPTLRARYDAIKTFTAGLTAVVETPDLSWFETHSGDTVAFLAGCLGLLSGHGVSATRFSTTPADWTTTPAADPSGTRLYVAVADIPVAIVVGWSAAERRFGLWMVRHGALNLGYIDIDPASIVGAYVTDGLTPGGECVLGLTGHIPEPVNLDPLIRLELDSSDPDPNVPNVAKLSLFLIGGETTTVDDDLAFHILPEFSVTTPAGGNMEAFLGEKVLPLVKALAAEAGLTQEVLDSPVIKSPRVTVEHVIIASAGVLAATGGLIWAFSDPDAAWSLVGTSVAKIADGINGAAGLDILFVEDATSGGKAGKRFGVQMPELDRPTLVDDPKLELVLGTDAERPRIPLLFVPGDDPSNTRFEIGLALRDIGLRITGADGRPLLSDIVGLGAVQATFDFDIGPGDWSNVDEQFPWTEETLRYGFQLALQGIALPFGQGQSEDDPVAGSLMSEGGDNPGIDVEVSYFGGEAAGSDEGFKLAFPQASDPNSGRLDLPLDMQFGPLELTALAVAAGVAAAASTKPIAVTFDGSFGLGPLQITVDDFGLSIPVNSIADPGGWDVTLSGLAIEFDQDPIQISGALLKTEVQFEGKTIKEYLGSASVRVGTFELSAIGAYAALDDGDASLFIFAMVPVPLGGPPCFFIEGLAGGFGYNRGFNTPPIHEIADNPLMVALKGTNDDLLEVLRGVQEVLPIKRGSYWFAAGVKFSSFVFIKGAALLYVLFDQGFEIGLLGHASIQLPDPSAPLLSVGLVLSVGFTTRGDQGPMLWAEAQLTEDSWVLHSSMRLTGGFALRTWFNSGETVLSIGGYHPAFKAPDGFDYPVVPRVGLRWKVSNAVSVKGECYFAITPREAMAGGALELVGKFGPVKAWLSVGVDILIGWDPFYYDLRAHVSVGFEVDLWLFTLRMSIGVKLEIKGPELSGKATIDLSLVTFTVRFGSSSEPKRAAIEVSKFAKSHLQLPDVRARSIAGEIWMSSLKDGDGVSPFDFTVTKGVVTGSEGDDSDPVINPEASFLVRTRVPFNQANGVANLPSPAPRIDFLPSAKLGVDSVITVVLLKSGGGQASGLELSYDISPLPKAMFLGKADLGEDKADALLEPDAEGGSTTELPDQLVIVARAEFPEVPRLSAYGTELAEFDHHMPLGQSSKWKATIGEVDPETLGVAGLHKPLIHNFSSAVSTDIHGVTKMSSTRQANVARLSTATNVVSYLSSVQDPEKALNSTVTPAAAKAPNNAGRAVAAWRYRPELLAVGAIYPARSRMTRASALTATTVQGVRSAGRSSKVPAPSVVERESFLMGVRLRTVSPTSATLSAGGSGRSVHRTKASAEATKALDRLGLQLAGRDPKRRQGAQLRAGMTQVFDVPDDGLPRSGGKVMRLHITGNQVGRLLFVGLDGTVLSDTEFGPGRHNVALPGGTKRVITAGLGQPTAFRRAKKSDPKLPGKQPGGAIPGKGGVIPGKGGVIPGKGGVIPGKGGVIPGKQPGGIIPGKQPGVIIPGKLPGGIIPGKLPSGIIPGKLPSGIIPGKLPSPAQKQAAQKQAAQKQAAQKQAAQKQAAQKQAAQKQAAQKQAAQKQAAQKQAAQKQAAQKQAAQKQAAQKQAAQKQAAQKQAAQKQAAQSPIAKKPAMTIPMRPGGGMSAAQMSRVLASQNRGRRPRPGLKLLGGSKLGAANHLAAKRSAQVLHRGKNPALIHKDPRKAAMIAELARKKQISDVMRERMAEAREQQQRAIDLRLPRGRAQGLFTSRLARRDVATVGFDEGSRFVRVGGRSFLARGSTVEIVEGLGTLRPLQTAQARDITAKARRIRVTMPAATRTLIVIASSSASGHLPLAQAIQVQGQGAALGKAKLVVTPGQGALVFPVQAKSDYSVELTIARGFQVVGVVGGPGTPSEWALRLASLDEWDIVEDGPLAPTGTTTLRLEVSK